MKEFSGGIQDTTGHSSEQPDLFRSVSGGPLSLFYCDAAITMTAERLSMHFLGNSPSISTWSARACNSLLLMKVKRIKE